MSRPELPEEQERLLATRIRKHLRDRIRKNRAALPEAAAQARSARIIERLVALPSYVAATGVGLFWPLAGKREVDLRELDRMAREAGKRVYYPFLRGQTTGFGLVDDPSQLVESDWGFRQPADAVPAAANGEIEWIAVPALLLASDGHRLGYGRGFYDATLPDYCPPGVAVGVGFEFQLVPEVPSQPHDVRVDWIVSDERAFHTESKDAQVETSAAAARWRRLDGNE
ncbi:MAG: 5-formyltetrahydrofolate cyclo-ligase [Polyangiaceae bacterium]|nr:5-formyltetrahydrofolate cyclo-ligase [Myxococcales bacterium]MCB9588290.1 5-formyltetrahydrofolate cyclo-ligase [Polyangiaceae bacterium]